MPHEPLDGGRVLRALVEQRAEAVPEDVRRDVLGDLRPLGGLTELVVPLTSSDQKPKG
jgi:Zn-dependent protease